MFGIKGGIKGGIKVHTRSRPKPVREVDLSAVWIAPTVASSLRRPHRPPRYTFGYDLGHKDIPSEGYKSSSSIPRG